MYGHSVDQFLHNTQFHQLSLHYYLFSLLSFAAEPKEKLVGKEDKVVESFKSKTEGHLQSTVDHVMEVTHSVRVGKLSGVETSGEMELI